MTLKSFFEENPLAQKAAHSIRDGREIELILRSLDTTSTAVTYTFVKRSGKNVIEERVPTAPDMTFSLSQTLADELSSKSFANIGQVGLHIFDKILSNDPNQRVAVKLHAGVLSVIAGGYLGVLATGGTEIAGFMASRGFGSLSRMKDLIRKLKGS